jgi:proline iminopeptidase
MKTNDQITQPTLMADGLAIYHIGQGEPLFLMPYPHASASAPTVDTKLATLLASLPRQVLTFDPPGAYSSARSGRANLPEMLECALETLSMCQISEPIDVIGHSMSGLCALALAIEHPERVRRLVLVGSVSGFPAVRRWSMPHNWRWWRDPEYWQVLWWGFRLFIGWNNLAVHKRLNNLVETASFVDKSLAELAEIEAGDRHRPPPKRDDWFKTVRVVDYKARLPELQVPTLLGVGRYDPQTPVACSQELARGIPYAKLVIFDNSGHAPFLEEPGRFIEEVGAFLSRPSKRVRNTFSVSAANSFAGLCQNLSRLPACRATSNGYGGQLCLIKTNEPHR